MSNVIDQKVVEMRFDNKQFENNVQTSLSTLDRLKKSLNMEGATKGLENVDAASKKLNFSGLSSAVETVQAKFSAFEVMAVTALANITNSAINAGKQMLHSLTIEPVSQGFNEYELKMGSIQTIMASTGASLEEVNGYLADLNEYSDKTIYSFADMTQNIGKFTNAGVKLEDAVLAIKGISNEAAISGANTKAAEMAAAAARAARRELDEHSPSKVGYEIGDFFGVAFVGAIGDYADKSYRAGAEMGSKARIGLTEAVSKISDYINSDMDTQPTIRPVLDLSNVQSGTRQINAMFSRTQAMSINANMSRAHTSGNQNGGFQDGSAATYNYFTQNNYSPKALSRVEIYRQTKNQFSAMKGTVSKR